MAKRRAPGKGKTKRKNRKYERYVAGGIVLCLVVIGLVFWGPMQKHGYQEKKPKEQVEKSGTAKEKIGKKRVAKVAIVIDDMGQDLTSAREVLALPARITLAVMPGLPNSQKIAALISRQSRDLLLHQPMEHHGKSAKQAPGMLRADMTPMDFLNTLTENVQSVPNAIGVNNHEGSALTENKEAMKFLMAELKTRNLLFLDSLTSAKSVAYTTAKEFGLRTARRDVFLDNESDNPEYIGKQLKELTRIAKEHGRAIGIGHPHPATIAALRKWLPTISEQGVEIVPLSKVIQ